VPTFANAGRRIPRSEAEPRGRSAGFLDASTPQGINRIELYDIHTARAKIELTLIATIVTTRKDYGRQPLEVLVVQRNRGQRNCSLRLVRADIDADNDPSDFSEFPTGFGTALKATCSPCDLQSSNFA
jgi:hypothetical protein